jgi:hypothetical protein
MNLVTVTVLTLALCLLPGVLSAQCANNANIYSFVYNNKTYEVVKENLSWSDASACAVQRGGKLAEIDSQAEQTAIYTQLASYASITVTSTRPFDGGGAGYVWLGGTDRVREGAWIWDGENTGSGTQFWQGLSAANGGSTMGGLYTNWGNEPDNYGGNPGQDALAIALSNWPLGTAGQWNDLNEANKLYYLIEYPNIVPVELTTFSAERISEGVHLHWRTATESNNLGWTVERREEGRNWLPLAFIPGRGTTNVEHSYSYIDREAPARTSEYRLQQIDTDGRTENSHPVKVHASAAPTSPVLYQNHPNPFRERTTISYTVDGVHPVALTVTDVSGREVLRFVDEAKGSAGLRTMTFDGTVLPPGIYICRLETGRFIHARVMLLVK